MPETITRELQTDSWRPEMKRDLKRPTYVTILKILCLVFGWFIVLITFPFGLLCFVRVVNAYERAVVFRLGLIRGHRPIGPGMILVLPYVDSLEMVDMRVVTFDVPSQEILSKDACTVTVDAVVYYKVVDAYQAIQNVENYRMSSWILAATTLRAVFGRNVLADILSEKEKLAEELQIILDKATAIWGMKIENVEIKDLRLPLQLQRAMAAEAEATRDARARIISAEGEKMAAVNLREASAVIASSPAALKLRYLQTISTIAAEKKSTILFPVPLKM